MLNVSKDQKLQKKIQGFKKKMFIRSSRPTYHQPIKFKYSSSNRFLRYLAYKIPLQLFCKWAQPKKIACGSDGAIA